MSKSSHVASGAKTIEETVSPGAPYVVPTKLRPPNVRSGLLQRPDLVERLRGGRERTLTLVCAPAGYGKTTLLAQWAAADADRTAFAWVSLDAMDSDPARLWAHVITALQEVHERVGERSLMAFAAGPRAVAETGLPLLVEELGQPSGRPRARGLARRREPCLRRVAQRVRGSRPSEVQVVISTRHDPRLPIARLRAHGDLTELRARDLSVSATEAVALWATSGSQRTTSASSPSGPRAGWRDYVWLRSSSRSRRTPGVSSTSSLATCATSSTTSPATSWPRQSLASEISWRTLRCSRDFLRPCATPSSSAPTPASMLADIERANFFSRPTRHDRGPNTGTTISSRMS